MKSLLILRNIKVENANAIAGLTYGFPAISSFLGFTHALSRSLEKDHGLRLGGCAVVCHHHHVRTHQPAGWGDHVFSLTRNPLTKDANSPAFVEEGRMHMEVSLVIECDFTGDDFDFGTGNYEQDVRQFESAILNKVLTQRLAGGTIQAMRRTRPVEFVGIPEDNDKKEAFRRVQMRRLLPGFVLVDRSDLLSAHFQKRRADNPKAELIDAWLDFAALKYGAQADQQAGTKTDESAAAKVTWQRIPKPADGWLVPMASGFKAISPLYPNGAVANTRDATTPFRFVESAYSVGQWISPHRIQALEQLFWRYRIDADWYLCRNSYQAPDEGDPLESESEPAAVTAA
jgi:CRISPR-associated protein Csy2